jgi:MerR family redox-sensitive transcriptional activator SoxR
MNTDFPIGEVARRAGLRPSAIRYYESEGLLPKNARVSGQRRYDEEVFARLDVIRLARDSGFTIAEVKTLLTGFARDTPPSVRWTALATRKLKEVEALIDRAKRTREFLKSTLACGCVRLEDCARFATQK